MLELEPTIDPLAMEIAFWIEAIVDPDHPADELGSLALSLSEKLRTLAIALLVARGESQKFYWNLVRSGRVWRTYLKRMHEHGSTDDHHFCSGRFEPLLDAIAAGDFTLAREIAQLSPPSWRQMHEYEDDYCFGRCVQILNDGPPLAPDASNIITQWNDALSGQDGPRLALAVAFLERAADAFEEGFQALLDAREAEIERNKIRGQLEEPPVLAQRHVFVEGLALLRLAGRYDIPTADEYRFCPSTARFDVDVTLPEDRDPDMRGWLS